MAAAGGGGSTNGVIGGIGGASGNGGRGRGRGVVGRGLANGGGFSQRDPELLNALAENAELKKDLKVLQDNIHQQDVACQEWDAIYQKRFKELEARKELLLKREDLVKKREESVEAKAMDILTQLTSIQEEKTKIKETSRIIEAARKKTFQVLDLFKTGTEAFGNGGQSPAQAVDNMYKALLDLKLTTKGLEDERNDHVALILAQQAALDYDWSDLRKKEEELSERLADIMQREDKLKELNQKEEDNPGGAAAAASNWNEYDQKQGAGYVERPPARQSVPAKQPTASTSAAAAAAAMANDTSGVYERGIAAKYMEEDEDFDDREWGGYYDKKK